jgi:hypothetical protein
VISGTNFPTCCERVGFWLALVRQGPPSSLKARTRLGNFLLLSLELECDLLVKQELRHS